MTQETGQSQSLRNCVYEILERSRRGHLASRIFDLSMVGLILANVTASVIETVPWVSARHGEFLDRFDTFCVAAFVIEYLGRLWTAPEHPIYHHVSRLRSRLRMAGTPLMIVDLIAILPFFVEVIAGVDLGVMRVVRIVRFYRLARYVPALMTIARVIAAEWRALLGSGVLFLGLLLVSAVLMFLAEGHLQPEALGDVPRAMWWAVVTLSTVGYGDIVPITGFGKLIATAVMVMGLVFFALPVGIIASGFQEEIHRRDFVVSFAMVARVPLFERLDAPTIARLVGLLTARKIAAGAIIFSKNDDADGMYFIASGEVEVELPQGAVSLGEGDFFGEIALLSGDAKRSATVTCTKACELLVLETGDFLRLMSRSTRVAEAVRAIAKQRKAEMEAAEKEA